MPLYKPKCLTQNPCGVALKKFMYGNDVIRYMSSGMRLLAAKYRQEVMTAGIKLMAKVTPSLNCSRK